MFLVKLIGQTKKTKLVALQTRNISAAQKMNPICFLLAVGVFLK